MVPNSVSYCRAKPFKVYVAVPRGGAGVDVTVGDPLPLLWGIEFSRKAPIQPLQANINKRLSITT